MSKKAQQSVHIIILSASALLTILILLIINATYKDRDSPYCNTASIAITSICQNTNDIRVTLSNTGTSKVFISTSSEPEQASVQDTILPKKLRTLTFPKPPQASITFTPVVQPTDTAYWCNGKALEEEITTIKRC